jgi:hypothetical protein
MQFGSICKPQGPDAEPVTLNGVCVPLPVYPSQTVRAHLQNVFKFLYFSIKDNGQSPKTVCSVID